MPRYDFKNIPANISIKPKQKSDTAILLDGKKYQEESINTQFIKKIEYKNSSGSIIIEGLFDLSKSSIENLISLKHLSLIFSPDLKAAYKQQFDNPKIFINFKLHQENEEMLKKHLHLFKKEFNDFDTDYKEFIKFSLDEFNDINILEMKNEFNKEKNNKFEFGFVEIKQEKNNFIEINDNIDDDNISEEEINNNKNNNNEVINFFPFSSDDNEKENEIENSEEKSDTQNKKINYIKAKDIDNYAIDKQKINFGNKLLKKYTKKILKDEISKNYLMPININNSFIALETNKDKIDIKNVFINENLKQFNSEYKKDILQNFLNLLTNHNNFINAKNVMKINDYTFVLLSLIKNIEKKISEIKKSKENEIYILKLEKINSTLKLFHILFLNCFYPLNENNNFIEDENLYDDFSSLKVQTMRKKLLIEWCMTQEKNYLNKTDLININQTKIKNKEILTKQIMSFGQIKSAIKSNLNKNLFINSKLSYLSENEIKSNKTLSYLIKGQKGNNELNKIFISYEANEPNLNMKIKNTWISFFLQALLYKEKNNEYIIKSIDLIEENAKPLIKDKLELNYVLLKLYEKIIKGVKDINDLNDLLNAFSNNNLFSKNNSDHFIQFIIMYFFSKIIHIIIPEFNDYNTLYKKNYFLLMQIISEILSCEINDKNDENIINDLIIIIKLLHISNINIKLKQKIFVDIISKQNLISIEAFWSLYNKENLTLLNKINKEYINGMYYLTKNDLLKAFKSFFESKKYKIALDIYLKYFFSLIDNNINFQDVYTNLKSLNENAPFLFNDFYFDFSQFISFKVFKDKIDYNEIMTLLNKFIYKYSGKNKSIYLDEISYRYIVKELCELLKEKRERNENLIICGNLKLNELGDIAYEERNILFNDAFKDLIGHKNFQFLLDEY